MLFRSRTKPVLDGAGTFVDVVPVPDDGRDPATVARMPGVRHRPRQPRLQVRGKWWSPPTVNTRRSTPTAPCA